MRDGDSMGRKSLWEAIFQSFGAPSRDFSLGLAFAVAEVAGGEAGHAFEVFAEEEAVLVADLGGDPFYGVRRFR